MGVDVEQFSADHADEQKREPVLARGGPVDVKPERGRKKGTEEFFAALGNAELHLDGWTAPRRAVFFRRATKPRRSIPLWV